MAHLPPSTAAAPEPRDAFERHLREWHATHGPGEVVGEIGDFGGRGWTFVSELGRVFRLHADATWEGVGRYLEVLEIHPGADWWVGVNEKGGKNKVRFGTDREVIPARRRRPQARCARTVRGTVARRTLFFSRRRPESRVSMPLGLYTARSAVSCVLLLDARPLAPRP